MGDGWEGMRGSQTIARDEPGALIMGQDSMNKNTDLHVTLGQAGLAKVMIEPAPGFMLTKAGSYGRSAQKGLIRLDPSKAHTRFAAAEPASVPQA